MLPMSALFQGFALTIGLCVGSFLNVCIGRMPEDRSVAHPPSHCPSCGHQIKPWENIPVLSWIALRARCSGCGVRISPLYPTIELLVGVLSLLLFRHLVADPAWPTGGEFAAWAVYLVFLSMLVALSFIDLRHYIIPDEFSIYAVPVGVAGCLFTAWMGWPDAVPWRASVLGALLGGGGLGLVMVGYRLVRGEDGMGFGDVKLLAMIGAFLGAIPAVPFVVLISSILGSAVGILLIITRGRGLRAQVPFGPFLALGALVYLFFGDVIIARWLPAFYLIGA